VLNDGVTFNGTSYISIAAGTNHPPDTSSGFWSVLAGQGATGAAGTTGATGATGVAGATGEKGTTGATGTAGATGAAGTTGATGAVGSAGAAGATGVTGTTGATGLQWRGAWSGGTAYVLNDGVTFNGTSYISIAAGTNHPPDTSSGFWSVLAGQGATGANGATGVAGTTGATGTTGAAGTAGATGAAGTTGATGIAGAKGATGTTGATGTAGATGATGIAGATGEKGTAGATGAAGPTGAAGTTGATGAPGPVGSAGAAGATGATGLHWRGEWNAATAYVLNDGVSFNGTSYISIGPSVAVNRPTPPRAPAQTNNPPDTSPGFWSVLAQQGATGAAGAAGAAGATGTTGIAGTSGAKGATGVTGAAGPTGVAGSTGATGATGVAGIAGTTGATGATGAAGSAGTAGAPGSTGVAGPTGATGLQWRGAWSGATAYALNDAVSLKGTSYISIAPGTNNQPDASPAFWSVLAGQGSPGTPGATGATGAGAPGATGPTGPAGATGAPGSGSSLGTFITGGSGEQAPDGINLAMTIGEMGLSPISSAQSAFAATFPTNATLDNLFAFAEGNVRSSVIFVVAINGIPTRLTCTMVANSCNDVSDSVQILAGQTFLIYMSSRTGGAAVHFRVRVSPPTP
jgi:hypothetical protein